MGHRRVVSSSLETRSHETDGVLGYERVSKHTTPRHIHPDLWKLNFTSLYILAASAVAREKSALKPVRFDMRERYPARTWLPERPVHVACVGLA